VVDDLGLITITDPLSPISEAYRTLRMNLQFAALDTELRTLLITSAGPDEGKSTTLVNLAITIAQTERSVIMVDCDLRRPGLHSLFGLSNETGLTTMVVDNQALENPPLQPTGIDGLRLLASGPPPPRPPDLLGSKRMDTVIERLLAHADLLLFDAPPVMAATDAIVLSTKVDGVLLVASAGRTKREHAQRAVERLKKVKAHLVGAVLTNARLDTSLQTYYA